MTTSPRSLRRRAAWAAPVLTAAVVGGVALLPSTASASAHPALPSRTAAQLLADVQSAQVSALSGTVVETARLGLPTLPGADSAATLSLQTLVTGTHTARVWLDGPERQRLALLGQLSESDVVHDGSDLWTYASSSQKVQHTVLPADKAAARPDPSTDVRSVTPEGVAQQALKAVDASTEVTVERTARVAGRPVYTLVLAPRDSRSTVRRVAIAIDAATKVPLRVQVFGAATRPAFETAFTDVSFRRPAASVFTFRAPQGSTVTTKTLAQAGHSGTPDSHRPASTAGAAKAGPSTLGKGWTTVAVLPAGSGASVLTGGTGSTGALLGRLTTTLPSGDRLLQSALVNALLTKDGRVLIGAVSPAVLQQAAAGQLG